MRNDIVNNRALSHERTVEYGADIIEAVVTGKPCRVHGNVLNTGLIPNLPSEAVVEVPCLVDGRGVQGVHSGPLPIQCAALNMTNISVQLLAIEAAMTGNRDFAYQAAFLDPHTSSELPLDDIRRLCDDLFDAHEKSLVI